MFPDLLGVKGSDDEEVKRKAAIARIDSLEADLVIYTDGSAMAGCRKGGSAAVVTAGNAAYQRSCM